MRLEPPGLWRPLVVRRICTHELTLHSAIFPKAHYCPRLTTRLKTRTPKRIRCRLGGLLSARGYFRPSSEEAPTSHSEGSASLENLRKYCGVNGESIPKLYKTHSFAILDCSRQSACQDILEASYFALDFQAGPVRRWMESIRRTRITEKWWTTSWR